MNLLDIINLDLAPAAYLTVVVMALFTSMAVQAFVKPAMSKHEDTGSRYELYLNLSALAVALAFSYLGVLAADVWGSVTVALLVQTAFRGFVAMFLAVFGYKGYKGVYKRVSGAGND
jgi:uncharacterized membrane protein YiaA